MRPCRKALHGMLRHAICGQVGMWDGDYVIGWLVTWLGA